MADVADNESAAAAANSKYVDNGWPHADGEHAVSEFAANISGALSPFGSTEFPLPVEDLPFVHAKTVVNR